MRRLDPLSIQVLRDNLYSVTINIDGENCEHRFDSYINELGSRIVQHEDSFYCKTWDIPETEWLEKSIYYLDIARSDSQNANVSEPVTLVAISDKTYQMTLADGSNEIFQIAEAGDRRKVSWGSETADAVLKRGLWKLSPDTPPIAKAVLSLHQAKHPVYKIE